jgi:hypothetical protein
VRKAYQHQHTLALEAWTEPDAADIRLKQWDRKVTVLLYDWNAFSAKMDHLLNKGSITANDYADLATVLHQSDAQVHWFGLIGDKNGGTNYYDGQFVRLELTNGKPGQLDLFTAGKGTGVDSYTAWDHRDSKGQPLAGKAKWQMRRDNCDYGANWRTE